jgi:hypothetical protein
MTQPPVQDPPSLLGDQRVLVAPIQGQSVSSGEYHEEAQESPTPSPTTVTVSPQDPQLQDVQQPQVAPEEEKTEVLLQVDGGQEDYGQTGGRRGDWGWRGGIIEDQDLCWQESNSAGQRPGQ